VIITTRSILGFRPGRFFRVPVVLISEPILAKSPW
jgi:hypothetical protein